MKRFLGFVGVLVMVLAFSGSAFSAAEFGSKDEAMAMVKRAIAHVDQVGIEKAGPEFSDPKGKWIDRDLYLNVAGLDGIRVAHGLNPKLIGKSLAEAVDINNKAYGKEIMEVATAKGTGWVDFTFTDPVTKKLVPKSLYVERKGNFIFMTGIYLR